MAFKAFNEIAKSTCVVLKSPTENTFDWLPSRTAPKGGLMTASWRVDPRGSQRPPFGFHSLRGKGGKAKCPI